MNAHARKPMPRIALDYRDLEDEVYTAVNMSDIACELVEGVQCAANRRNGGIVMTEDEMAMLSFSIYHANKLVRAVKAKWNEVHESQVAAEDGKAVQS